MSTPLANLDNVPPELADKTFAWCCRKYGNDRGRDAAIDVLRQQGISPERGAPAIGQAIARSQGWSREQWDVLADAAEGWDEPVPLSAVPSVPYFPVDIYPKWIADEVLALAEFTQTPPDLAGTVVLSVLSTAIGGRARVEVRPGWTEPVNLYTCVVLPPAARKSPVFAPLVAPVLTAEKMLADKARESLAEKTTARSVADKAAATSARKAAEAAADPDKTEQDKKKAEEEAIASAALASAIEIPVMPQLVADDVGPEKAAILLAEQGGRLAILSAEGGPFVSLAGRYTREPNLEVFLKGWSGDMLRVDRVVRASNHVPNPALTLGLAAQPEVLKQIHQMPGFHGRGLLARVLFSMPASTVGFRKIRTDPVPYEVTTQYVLNMTGLVSCYAAWTDPAVLRLAPDAAELLMKFAESIEPFLRPDGNLGHIAGWAGKLIGTSARIAALLHCALYLGDAYRFMVSAEAVSRAIRLGGYFIEHALAAFDFMGADPVQEDARAVLGWIRRTGQAQFTQRDLHRAMQSRFRKAEDPDAPLEVLTGNGWIREVKTKAPGQQGRGRPRSPAFEVHPAALRGQY